MEGDAYTTEGQEGHEQDLGGLDDAALDGVLQEGSGNADEGGTEEAVGVASSKVAKDGGEGGDEAEQEEKAPTVEDVSKELAAIRAQLEQRTKERDHWQQVTSRHADELGQLRQIKQKLLERKQHLDSQDMIQRMVDDPRAYHAELREGMKLDTDLAELERREKLIAQQAQQAEARHHATQYLGNLAPDLRDNMDVIAEIMGEHGDGPEVVERFRRNPLDFPAPLVASVNGWAKERRRVRELEAKVKELEARPRTMLQKIEQAARQKPLTNAGGGKGRARQDIGDDQIASLSDKELNALLQDG